IFIVLDSGNSAIRLIHSIDYRTEPTQVKLQSPLAKPTVETKKKKRRALEFVSIKELGGKLEKSKEGDKFTHNPVYYEIIHCYGLSKRVEWLTTCRGGISEYIFILYQ